MAVPTTAPPNFTVVDTATSAIAMTVQAFRDKLHNRSATQNIQVRTKIAFEVIEINDCE
jgi:hypothetical protein